MNDKLLIVGLGNPGEEYHLTYHNIGTLAVEHLAKELTSEDAPKWQTNGSLKSELLVHKKYILLKPTTFMNESGVSVRTALRYFKIPPKNLVVIHDESDLILGRVKCVQGGRAAGHRGIQSIIDTIKTEKFWRVRIGFRPKIEIIRKSASDLVLKKITKTDLKILYGVFAEVGATIEKVIVNNEPSLPSTIDDGGTVTS